MFGWSTAFIISIRDDNVLDRVRMSQPGTYYGHPLLLSLLFSRVLPLWLGVRILALAPGS